MSWCGSSAGAASSAAGAGDAPAGEERLPAGAYCVEAQAAGVCVLPSTPGMVPSWHLRRLPALIVSRAVAVQCVLAVGCSDVRCAMCTQKYKASPVPQFWQFLPNGVIF